MSSGGKGSGRTRKASTKSHLSLTPSVPSLKRNAKQAASMINPDIEPASKELSGQAAWEHDGNSTWTDDAAMRGDDDQQMNHEDTYHQQLHEEEDHMMGDPLAMNDNEEDNVQALGSDPHQLGGADPEEEDEENGEEEDEEEVSDENDEGEMDAIDAGAEGEGDEEGGQAQAGDEEKQGAAVTVPLELTETIREGMQAAEARRDAVLEKIDALSQSGVLQLDEMKARFLNEMTRLKSDTVAQAERAFHHWRELSHETREAEVKLQSVKRLVEVLGTHV